MASESCRNGTEQCNEALGELGKPYDVVVNTQGDEPLIEPEIIDGIVKALQASPDAVFSTAVTSLKPEDAFDTNRVKCVVDNRGYAIYFSRGLIPFNKSGKVNPQFPYLLHLGIQSFDSKFLKIYPELPPTPLQLEEDLEQLKVLENGYKMKIPSDGFGASSKLQILDLGGNRGCLPEHPAFSSLLELQELYLRRMQTSAFPLDVSALKNIRILDLSQNSLDSIPESIKDLTSLTELNLSDNNISSLPAELGLLESSLQLLKFEGNPVKKHSEEILDKGSKAIFKYLKEKIIEQ